MTKTKTPLGPGHIIHPAVEHGSKALALCGAKVKVHVLNDELAEDHLVCRPCIKTAVTLLDEASDILGHYRASMDFISLAINEMDKEHQGSQFEGSLAMGEMFQEQEFERIALKEARAEAQKKQGKKKK